MCMYMAISSLLKEIALFCPSGLIHLRKLNYTRKNRLFQKLLIQDNFVNEISD